MMRVRLKADGRLVEVTSEGQERVAAAGRGPADAAQPAVASAGASAPMLPTPAPPQTRLTQAEFVARIGFINGTYLEQGSGRSARPGPRAAQAPIMRHVAFSVLRPK